MSELVRLEVNLNKETAEALKGLARRHNVSVTEAVRRAVAVIDYIDGELREGRRVQVLDPSDGSRRELWLM